MTNVARFNWLEALRLGAIGGAAAILACLVGMVESFSERDIIAGVISMGHTVLLGTVLVLAYVAARRVSGGRWYFAVLGGAMAGLTVGAMLFVLVLLTATFNLRTMFVNASPLLIEVLTFGEQNMARAAFDLLSTGLLVGGAGGLIYSLPARLRSAVLQGLAWVGLIGLLQELLRVTFSSLQAVEGALAWMFGSRNEKGLSVVGAVAVFIVVAGGGYLRRSLQRDIQARVEALPPAGRQAMRWGSLALAAAVVLYLPNLLGSILSDVANTVGLYILAGLGLNIVVGFAGLLDLGYVAFYAIGAYVMGVLTTSGGELATSFQWTFWQALPVALLGSIAAGVILGIPVLKIRGDYLAIVTLGFGEIIRILALSDFLKPYIGGSQGIVQVARGSLFGVTFDKPQTLYYLIVASVLVAVFVAWRLRDSRAGRAWKAMREDEDVAQAMGINLVSTKLLAFGAGAAFSGLAGAIFASKLGTIYPHSFALLFSINVLSLIIVGGMGSVPGVFVGALALVGLPELLREFAEYRLLIYGVVLIAMMLTRPEGFLPDEIHKRELHEEEPAVETVATAAATPAP